MTRSDQDSVFGHTYQGVPNPQVPFEHPYPSRYHGPIFTEPRFGLPFQANPYAMAPFSGELSQAQSAADFKSRIKGTIMIGAIGALLGAGIAYKAPKLSPKNPAVAGAAIGGVVTAALAYGYIQFAQTIGHALEIVFNSKPSSP